MAGAAERFIVAFRAAALARPCAPAGATTPNTLGLARFTGLFIIGVLSEHGQ